MVVKSGSTSVAGVLNAIGERACDGQLAGLAHGCGTRLRVVDSEAGAGALVHQVHHRAAQEVGGVEV